MIKSFALLALFATSGLYGATSAVHAEDNWPSRPVKIIVPITAGANIDIVARAVASKLSEEMGQPFIIENRPGAGATLGPSAVFHSQPDGYTLLFHSATFTIASAVMKKLPYDIPKDFSGITPVTNTPLLLVTPPGKFKNVKDLIEAAKAKNGTMNYATVGFGSASHFVSERLGLATGFKATSVPYRGTLEGLTDIMTGRVDFFFVPATTAMSLVRDGKLDALATTGRVRMGSLPNVPTASEAGIPDFDFDMWVGLFVPANTPKPIVDKLYKATAKVVQGDDFQKRLGAIGGQVMKQMPPHEFDQYVKKELQRNIEIAKAANISED